MPVSATSSQPNSRRGLASLCNRDRLPPASAVVIAAPLKIANGSPARVLAITPA